MPKSTRLSLDQLTIKSFVTNKVDYKGGKVYTYYCQTDEFCTKIDVCSDPTNPDACSG